MLGMSLTGKSLRLARLCRYADGRYVFVPLDHSVTDGPVVTAAQFLPLVRDIAEGGADGIMVHKGRARMIPADVLRQCALIIQLSGSTTNARDTNAKVLVGAVDEAVRLGADAVTVHVNVGSDTEAEQLADLGRVASACDRWGMPLIAMMYPRGPRVSDPHDPAIVAHAVNIAADLGADIVKTVLVSPPSRMADVVQSSPIPIVIAGGLPSSGGEPGQQNLKQLATLALDAGCAGLAAGRRVFTSPEPRQVVHELAALVHGRDLTAERTLQPRTAGAM